MDTVMVALRVMLSLAVVLGLLWYLQRRLTRRSRTMASANPVTVVTRQTITPKASIVVVDVEGKRLLLGVTEHSVTMLSSDDAPPTPEPAEVFAATLDTAMTQPAALGAAAGARTGVLAALRLGTTDRSLGANRPLGAMGGSILSPNTWRQTAAVFRRSR